MPSLSISHCRPTENKTEDGMTTSAELETTETNHKQSESEKESKNPFWSEIDSTLTLMK